VTSNPGLPDIGGLLRDLQPVLAHQIDAKMPSKKFQ